MLLTNATTLGTVPLWTPRVLKLPIAGYKKLLYYLVLNKIPTGWQRRSLVINSLHYFLTLLIPYIIVSILKQLCKNQIKMEVDQLFVKYSKVINHEVDGAKNL